MRKEMTITVIITLFVIAPAWLAANSWYESSLRKLQNRQFSEQVFTKANQLGGAIQRRFALLEGLHAYVIANPIKSQLDATFEIFASALITGVDGIRNFGLAPDGTMSYIYPFETNEKALGHNLIRDPRPAVRADVERTLQTNDIVLSGPYELKQGGLGLVARQSVRVDNQFWGLATMVIDMPAVFLEAGIMTNSDLPPLGIYKADGELFFGIEVDPSSPSLTLSIQLPDGSWDFVSEYPKALSATIRQQLMIFRGTTLIAALLVILIIYLFSNRQRDLTEQVSIQTRKLTRELKERQQTEKALIESEKQLRELFEHSPVGLALCRMDGSLVSVNPAFADIIGYSIEEALSLSYWDITPQEYAPQEMALLSQMKQYGRYGPYEKEYRHKDGHLVPVRLNGMIVMRDGERFIWSSIENIEALKKAEIEKDELAEKLRLSQKMEALGTLAGGVAHDFNNILSAIIGFTELSLPHLDNKEKVAANLQQVLTASERAKNLVRQILLFSQQSEGKSEAVSLQTILLEVVETMRQNFEHSAVFDLDLDPGVGPILADPSQIHQIIMNLCTNAIQALPDQTGTVSISLKSVTKEDLPKRKHLALKQREYALLSISDNGAGIPPDVLPRIFEPFFTTKKKEKGIGMGLAVVHGAVQNNNGAIDVSSNIGKGTRFDVFLPLAQGLHVSSTVPENASADFKGSEKILWIDDEPMLVEFGRELLEPYGYRVTATASSLEALQLFRATPEDFDLIITDQKMPEMNGDVLTRKILSIRPEIPVIVCTGHSTTLTPDRAIELGIKKLLTKPVDKHLLLQAIHDVLAANDRESSSRFHRADR